MSIELAEGIRLLTRAQSIIEAEAHRAFGDERETLEDVNEQLDDIIEALEFLG